MHNRRKRKPYFERSDDAPDPIVVETRRRVHFSEIDLMAFVWFGRYPAFFEEGSEAMGRECGLSYKDFFEAKLRAPLVEYHVDFFKPLRLDEEFTIRTVLVWHEGARMNTEFYLIKDDGRLAASGYTVQVFIDVNSGEVCLISPELLQKCRSKWEKGEFHCKK